MDNLMNTQNTRLGINAKLRTLTTWCLIITYQFYSSVAFAQGIAGAVGSLHAPEVLQSANGLPIVNINRPSTDGVSRNEYEHFNVGQQGALLNNSPDIVLTQQAGYIDGNSALAGQSARIILNEVVSGNPSQLRGYTEVAGAAAQVVIANPNGITCNGCGFINSPRSVLTTGRAQFNNQGNLTGYRVESGQVTIEGEGLNASNMDQLDILARAVRVNSQIWANKLNLVTGKNEVDHETLQSTPLSSSDSTGVALDVAAIGGMYANRISLVGTEKGFGVNNQGQIAAMQDFQLTSEGQIQLSGITQSQAGLNISTTNTLENSGILAAKNIQATAHTVLNNSAEAIIHADQQLQLTVTENLRNQGRIQANTVKIQTGQQLDNQAILQGASLELAAANLLNRDTGKIQATGQLAIKTDQQLHNAGNLQAQALAVQARQLENKGTIQGQQLTLNSSDNTHNQATGRIIASEGSINLNTAELKNEGIMVAQQLNLTAESLNNTGGIQGLSTLTVNLQTLTNPGQLLGSLLNLNASKITNQGTVSGGETRIIAQEVHNQGKDSVLHGNQTLDLQQHILTNEGLLLADHSNIEATTLNNAATGNIRLKDGSLKISETLNNSGQLSAGQAQITTATLNNTGADALISAEDHLDLQLGSGTLTNEGVIQAGSLNINAARLINTLTGQVLVLKELGQFLLADYLNNNGQIYAQQLEIHANQFLQQGAGAWTVAENDLALYVTQGLTNTTRLQSGGDFTLRSQSLYNQNQGNIRSGGQLDIQLPGQLTNAGQIHAGRTNISSSNLSNTSTGRISTFSEKLAITTGSLNNAGTLLGHSVDLNATQLTNTHNLEAVYQLDATVGGLLQNSARISGGNTRIVAGSLTNSGAGAEIHAEQELNIRTAQDTHNTATMIAGSLLLNVNNLINTSSQALIAGMQYLGVETRTSLNNLGGATIFSDGNASLISGGTLLNESSEIEASGNLYLQAARLINRKALFETQTHVTTSHHSNVAIPPPSGYYDANRTYTETVTTTSVSKDSAPARILAGQGLAIVATQGSIDNYYSTISAGGVLDYQATALNNVAAVAANTVERSGTDTLYYKERYCKTRVLGKCFDYSTRKKQTTVAYNPAPIISLVTLASAVVSGYHALAGRGGSFSNLQRDLSLGDQPFEPVNVTARETLNQSLVTTPSYSSLTSSWMPETWQSGETGFKLPESGLMRSVSQPGHKYLVETNPRLTNYREFISSDYMIQRLDHNPDVTVKRLGDGFVEQRLVRDQILNLTGTQYLGDHQNIEQQYFQLMENALELGKNLALRPGIALTVAQIEQLRKPLVWMVEETFETAYGTETALVPRVYLGNAWDGHLRSDGAFIAAGNMDLELDNELNNQGTLLATENLRIRAHNITNTQDLLAEKQLILNTDADLINQGGLIQGGQVLLDVGGDLIHETISHQHSYDQADGSLAGTQTQLGRTATIQGEQVSLITGDDLNITGADIHAGQNLLMNIGGNVQINALQTLQSQHSNTATANRAAFGNSELNWKTSSLSAGGTLQLIAEGNLSSAGTDWQAGADVLLKAQDVTLTAVTNLSESYQHLDRRLKGAVTNHLLNETVVGNLIKAGGNLMVNSDSDLLSSATRFFSENGLIALQAEGDINLAAVQQQSSETHTTSKRSISFLSSTSRTNTTTTESSQAIGNSLDGNQILINAGNNLNITAGQLVAEQDLILKAGQDIQIAAGENTYSQTTESAKKRSGLMTSGLSLTIGNQRLNTDQQYNETTAAASTLGSLEGNINIQAGNQYTQVGSDLIALGGDISVKAQDIAIIEARETTQTTQQTRFKQSGLTLALESPIIDAVQTGQQMHKASQNTDSGRMQALAAGATALNAYNNAEKIADAVTALASGDTSNAVSLSLTVGSSRNSSDMTQTSNTARGSSLNSGGNINLVATGGGDQSNLLIQGSDINAANNLLLQADNQINILAAQNHASQQSDNQSSSAGVGVGINLGSKGFAAGITVSASAARGNADGEDLYHSNSQIKAGNQLHIQSGGDTHLIGAVAQGEQVTADIGGNLTIQSLQDTSRYDSKNQSASGSGTFGFGGASVSATYSQSEIDASYASVNQQSGIQAGDGGFQLKVAGDTELMGAVITSTDEAINNNRNSLDTASIQMQDINNHSRFSAEAFSVGTGGAGYGSDGEKESSVTQSGVSGLAGNTNARTGDASTGLQNSFDADKVQKETDAQLAITTQFRQQAHQAVGDYVTSQRTALQEQIANASTEEEKNLLQDQLNDLRNQEQAMNVVIGALTGFGEAALTKEVLSSAAEKMRDMSIESSSQFAGVVDENGDVVLSNLSGDSEGVRGDNIKLGGTRIDFDQLCGTSNERCTMLTDGRVLFDTGNGQSFDDFMKSDEGLKMGGLTGGIQGSQGMLGKEKYEPGSWQDKLIEAFAGTHDFIGGELSGLYDEQGNAKRGRSDVEKALHEAWSGIAILPSAPFAASEQLTPEQWDSLLIIMRGIK